MLTRRILPLRHGRYHLVLRRPPTECLRASSNSQSRYRPHNVGDLRAASRYQRASPSDQRYQTSARCYRHRTDATAGLRQQIYQCSTACSSADFGEPVSEHHRRWRAAAPFVRSNFLCQNDDDARRQPVSETEPIRLSAPGGCATRRHSARIVTDRTFFAQRILDSRSQNSSLRQNLFANSRAKYDSIRAGESPQPHSAVVDGDAQRPV